MMEKGDEIYDKRPPEIESKIKVQKDLIIVNLKYYAEHEEMEDGKWLACCQEGQEAFSIGTSDKYIEDFLEKKHKEFAASIKKEDAEVARLGYRTKYFENGKWFPQG